MKKIVMAEYDEYNSVFKLGEHQYAKLFSENNFKVLWLTPSFNGLTYFKNKDLYLKRKKLNLSTFFMEKENLYSYSPYSLFLYGNEPFFNTRFACKLSNKLIIPSINKIFKKNDFEDIDILWLSNPKYFYLKDLIKYKKLYYRCADDVSSNDNLPDSYKYFERRIFREADMVFVTSKNIIKNRLAERVDLTYLPNGVDLDNFSRKKYNEPEEFKGNQKRKCIYVGAIKEWFDVDLIDYISTKLLDIEFYFIGPININVEAVKNKKNVHFLGGRSYKDIPDFLYYSDVGIIPFKVNDFINGVNPIKLYEYMSVGLNVVSTNFEGISMLMSPAYLAKNNEQFAEYIIQALQKNNKENNIMFANKNTWKESFKIILQEII